MAFVFHDWSRLHRSMGSLHHCLFSILFWIERQHLVRICVHSYVKAVDDRKSNRLLFDRTTIQDVRSGASVDYSLATQRQKVFIEAMIPR